MSQALKEHLINEMKNRIPIILVTPTEYSSCSLQDGHNAKLTMAPYRYSLIFILHVCHAPYSALLEQSQTVFRVASTLLTHTLGLIPLLPALGSSHLRIQRTEVRIDRRK